MANPSRLARRPWLRFSLGSLLFVVLYICGTLAGHWHGYRSGYRAGSDASWREHLSQRNYRVRGLLRSGAQPEDDAYLKAEIRAVVETKAVPGTASRKPIEIWISPGHGTVSILASETEHERAQAYFDTIRFSEGFESGSHEGWLQTRCLYPVQDLLSDSKNRSSLSHEQLLGGLCAFHPKWYSSPPRSLMLSRGTLDVQGTPGDQRRVMLYLRALRAIHNPPCPN